MAQQQYQGLRIDGGTFEAPNFDDFKIGAQGRPSRNNSPRTVYQRVRGFDFNSKWYDDRVGRGAFGSVEPGRTNPLQIFLSSLLFFQSSEDEDAEWGPIRPLGMGGFGRVGLWQKRDRQNRIMDEVVCKEMRIDPRKQTLDELQLDNQKLLTEAAIHRDINTQHPGIAPHLRGYKFLEDHGEGGGRYRFYLEYCPHGTLSHISRLYRCWDTHLPEVFIWHVFCDLAKGCDALRDSPPADSKMLKWPNNGEDYSEIREDLYCLHLDMKPSNFLLGYPHTGDEYPSALINDFGLSVYTSYNGDGPKQNPEQLWWRGTVNYKPPEQTHYGSNWDIPPDGGWIRTRGEDGEQISQGEAARKRQMDNADFPQDVVFGPSMNIHGVGQTMFDLVTLTPNSRQLHDLRADTLEKYHHENCNHQIKESDISTKPPNFYSTQLRKLIHRCLDPSPAKRPTQLELLDLTRRGLRMAMKRARVRPRLYFRDHEINEMPLGNAKFNAVSDDCRMLIDDEFVNPDLPVLKLPRRKFASLPEFNTRPRWKKFYRRKNPHKRWFQPVFPPTVDVTSEEKDYGHDDDSDIEGGEAHGSETPSVSSDPDSVDDGDDHDQTQGALSENEQREKANDLRSLLSREHRKLVPRVRTKKLMRKNGWDLNRAAAVYGEKLARARAAKVGRQEAQAQG